MQSRIFSAKNPVFKARKKIQVNLFYGEPYRIQGDHERLVCQALAYGGPTTETKLGCALMLSCEGTLGFRQRLAAIAGYMEAAYMFKASCAAMVNSCPY